MQDLDPRHLSVIDELDRLGRERDDAWQVPRVEGELLHHIALASGAKLIVEIGTSYGFSGLFFAAALKVTGGKLDTIDVSQKKFDSSRATFERAGVGEVVQNHLGDARQVVAGIAGEIDLAFLDADKAQTRSYFELIWPRLRRGGAILTDNALTHRSELGEFVKYVRSLKGASSTEVPVGNGLEWTIKV